MTVPRVVTRVKECVLSDRDKITAYIEYLCVIDGMRYVEREHSLTVPGVVKFIFTDTGEIRSIIRDGKSYTDDDVRVISKKDRRDG